MPTPTSLHMSKMMLSMTLGGTMPSVTSTTFTGDKFERIGKMQREFYRWMGDNKSEFTNMMVISREAMELASSLEYENTHHNILFANPLNPLKKACGCRYGAGSEDPSAETWVWETLAVGGDPITKTDKEEEVRCNVEGEIVTVTRSPLKLEAVPSPTSSKFAKAKIGVFWDVKECPIPNGLDPASIYRNIKSSLAKKGYHGEVTITPYCDTNQFPDGPDEFESAGMKLVPADETERCRAMSCDICFWFSLDRKDKYTNVVVISGDNMDFLTPLEYFKQKFPVNVFLAQPENAWRWCPKCRKPLEDLVAESGEWFWESLAAGGDSITETQREELLGDKKEEDYTDCCDWEMQR